MIRESESGIIYDTSSKCVQKLSLVKLNCIILHCVRVPPANNVLFKISFYDNRYSDYSCTNLDNKTCIKCYLHELVPIFHHYNFLILKLLTI